MKVLLPIDDSSCSQAAVHALIAQMQPTDTEVCVLNVVEPTLGDYQSADVLEGAHEVKVQFANELVNRFAKELKEAGYASKPVVREGDAKHSIVQFAEEWKPDYIFIGSHGRTGWKHFTLGSVSEAVSRHVPCSVVIARNQKVTGKQAFR